MQRYMIDFILLEVLHRRVFFFGSSIEVGDPDDIEMARGDILMGGTPSSLHS